MFEDFAGPGAGKILGGRAVTGVQTFPAPGKLNLMLRVTGRRADGYHLLQTVIRFIDYGDTLTFRTREDGVVTRVNEIAGVPAGEDLAVRAAQRLQQASGTPLGADITLEKQLPPSPPPSGNCFSSVMSAHRAAARAAARARPRARGRRAGIRGR